MLLDLRTGRQGPPEKRLPNPLYRKWIDTYGGEEFGALVEAVLDLTDETCKDLNLTKRPE